MDDCPFCMIAIGHAGYVKPDWDMSSNVMNFTPLNPIVEGHRLFVPRKHIRAADSDPMLAGRVFEQAALWAAGRKEDYNLITSGGRSATQSVFHLHVHYVPRHRADGLALPWTGQQRDGAAAH